MSLLLKQQQFVRFAIFCVLLFSGLNGITVQAEETRKQFGDIEVMLGYPLTREKYRRRIEQHNVLERLKNEIRSNLQSRGVYADTAAGKIRITLTRFRLKSAASTIFLFYHSGRNRMAADVEIIEDGRTTRLFRENISHMPHPFAPSQEHSLNKMVRVYSSRLANLLDQR